jgi:hypothetical protein
LAILLALIGSANSLPLAGGLALLQAHAESALCIIINKLDARTGSGATASNSSGATPLLVYLQNHRRQPNLSRGRNLSHQSAPKVPIAHQRGRRLLSWFGTIEQPKFRVRNLNRSTWA